MLTTEHKKRSQHMEAVKNLDQAFLDSYIDVPPPPVKSKPKESCLTAKEAIEASTRIIESAPTSLRLPIKSIFNSFIDTALAPISKVF